MRLFYQEGTTPSAPSAPSGPASPGPTPGTPSGAVVTHAVSLVLPVPAARGRKHRRQVHAKIVLSWTWNHDRTRLEQARITGVPRRGTITIECRGRGCPRNAHVADARKLETVVKALRGSRYHAGDRLLITVRAPGALAERAEVVIRDGALPRAKLL